MLVWIWLINSVPANNNFLQNKSTTATNHQSNENAVTRKNSRETNGSNYPSINNGKRNPHSKQVDVYGGSKKTERFVFVRRQGCGVSLRFFQLLPSFSLPAQ
jgi:hypothetical protein